MTVGDLKERNEKILIRRQAGATLLEIATEFGITKERIRQIINEISGSTEFKDFVTASEAGRLLGFKGSSIRKLVGLRIIKCIKSGR